MANNEGEKEIVVAVKSLTPDANEIQSTKTATSVDNLKDFAMKKFNEPQTCI